MKQAAIDSIVQKVQAWCLDMGRDPSTVDIVFYDDGTYTVDFIPQGKEEVR